MYMNIFQVMILGVAGVMFAIQLKKEKAEYAILLGILIGVFIFASIFEYLKQLVQVVREIGTLSNIENTYIATLIKMLGITYLSEISCSICKDAGQQTIAIQIEMFSKITILIFSLPILLALIRSIQEFLP